MKDLTTPKFVHLFVALRNGWKAEEVESLIDRAREELEAEWYGDRYGDLSIYRDPRYLLEVVKCYTTRARTTVLNMVRFFQGRQIKPDSILDYYNGAGVSTLLLRQHFPGARVCFYNDVEEQKRFMVEFARRGGFQVDGFGEYLGRGGSFHTVILSEVFEHFKDPESFFDSEICPIVGRFLVHSSPFGSEAIGHFREHNGVDAKKYGARFHEFLEGRGFDLVYKGFNNVPRIYCRRD